MEDLPDATHEPVPAGTEVPLWEQVAANAVTPTEPYEFCGVPVVVRGLSVGQRLEHVEARRAGADPTSRQIYVEMISRCVIDPATDQAAFTVEQVEHLLDHAPAAEVEDLMRACNRLAGFTSDDEDDAGKRFLGLTDSRGVSNPERRFIFELAERLGRTVGELSMSMSSAELTEWRALQRVRNDEIEHARRQAEQRSKMGWRR